MRLACVCLLLARPASALLSPRHARTPSILRAAEREDESLPARLSRVLSALPRPQVSLPSLLGGAVLGIAAFTGVLLVPYGSAQSEYDYAVLSTPPALEKPVQLFEDILRDLQQSYVDEVNPAKLFETAVGSMLRSLDPYTEFENMEGAKQMQESVSGRYGGVGLVISSSKPGANLIGGKRALPRPAGKEERFGGVTVMDAFEGYAFDGGMRVGDRLLSVGGVDSSAMNVEQVRDLLRGEPDTDVQITFARDEFGANAQPRQQLLRRRQVRMSDVRLATYLGSARDGIGYINLAGFNAGSGKDFGAALLLLRMNAPHDLAGLVLDLRGNPGGLLDAAVEVASYLLPARSEVVSQVGRDGVQVVYRSAIEPIRPAGMGLVVLVNGGSASASEIVAGAVQDTDSGVILGSSKTFGKGLVQKIVPLPYDSALKYTVAKYYTPSGRCIQAVKYKGGRADQLGTGAGTGGSQRVEGEDADSSVVAEADRSTFFTARGRTVRDGGGIEPDMLVPDAKAGPAESLFLNKGVYFDFVSEFVKTHDVLAAIREQAEEESLSRADDARIIGPASAQNLVLNPFPSFKVADGLYDEFKKFVYAKINSNSLSVVDAFQQPLADLEKSLSSAGLQGALGELSAVKAKMKELVLRDMDAHRNDISRDLELSLLARELPDRLLIQKNAMEDPQISAAAKLLLDRSKYLALLQSTESPTSATDFPPRIFRLAMRDD